MTNVHVKLEHNQAINAKRDILLAEKDLLGLIRHIRAYNQLRKRSFTLKNKVKKDLASIKTAVKSIETNFPKEQEVSIAKHRISDIQEHEVKEHQIKKSIKKRKKDNIQSEIEDIEEKLAQLG